ncbi:ABC transporter permease [Streptomyces sp. NPDC056132]|uniref:ABC transporter permease n=1 Tax=Streptomyces sp. NPDC056132 TaxID=3345722 RepID=UPI0035D9A246
MRDVMAGEWAKAWSGKAWWLPAAFGILMSFMASLGYATQGRESIAQSRTDAGAVTADVVQAWMMMLLFASLYGAVSVAREYATGTIARSVLLSGSRTRLFSAKLIVTTAMGALYGVLAVGLAVASGWGLMAAGAGHRPVWTRETWLILLGVFVCTTLSAPWGLFIGWIVRNQMAAVGTLMGFTLLLDPGLQALFPQGAKYLMTIAMSSVYRDGKPELLSEPLALLVIAGWLAAAAFLARKLLTSRDVV